MFTALVCYICIILSTQTQYSDSEPQQSEGKHVTPHRHNILIQSHSSPRVNMSLHTDTLYWFRNVEFWEISILIELVVINNAGLFYITLKWDHLNNSSVMLGLIWPCGVREIDFWNLFLLNKSNLKINITNLTIKKKKKNTWALQYFICWVF